MATPADCDYWVKVLLVGNEGSGKTSAVKRYFEDKFEENVVSTPGSFKHFKQVQIFNL